MKGYYPYHKQIRVIKDKKVIPDLFDSRPRVSEGRTFIYKGNVLGIPAMIGFTDDLRYHVATLDPQHLERVHRIVMDRYLELVRLQEEAGSDGDGNRHSNGRRNGSSLSLTGHL